MMEKDLAYYKTLTYPTEVVREEDGTVVAFHPDLNGCVAQGDTADEALANLDEARIAWLEVRFAEHLPIPDPPDENYAGKVLVRMMPALHAAVARRANRQGVSINQFIVATLAESVGFAKAIDYMEIVREAIRPSSQIRPSTQQHPSNLPTTPKPASRPELRSPLGPNPSPKDH